VIARPLVPDVGTGLFQVPDAVKVAVFNLYVLKDAPILEVVTNPLALVALKRT
jgi:hypothetical protein